MNYVYDILLNLSNSKRVYDFYEWNQNDNIENIKKMKLVHVDRMMLDNLLYYDGMIDNDFLIKIYRTCEVYTNRKVKILDYCCLFSDGERVLAIEFNEAGNPMYKSKLLIDEEEEIAILANNLEFYPLTFEKREKILKNRFFTRNEIIIRNYLMKEIEECYHKKNYGKLRFLYEEYFEEKDSSYPQMMQALLDSMETCLDSKHMNIYQILKLSSKKKQV